MPYQLNGQLVTIKSQRLPHAAGAVAAARDVMTRALCPFMVVPPRSCPLSGHSSPQRRGPRQWTDNPFSLETGSPRSTNEINSFRKLIPCLLHREELGRRQARACNRLAADPAECQARSGVEFITPPPLQ